MLAPDPDRRVSTIDDALALLHGGARPPASARPASYRSDDEDRRSRKRREKRDRKAERTQHREERRRARAERRARGAPFVPRLLAQLGLFAASLVVWIVVGAVVPLVLVLLSLIFGGALRRAARACVGAARRTQGAMGRASRWLAGHRVDAPTSATRVEPQVRIDGGVDDGAHAPAGASVRVADPHDAPDEAEEPVAEAPPRARRSAR
jgi:hypothetical protein